MMTSVIPARLDFQCGHAALVSLPRVKGESSAQRSLRIALEKSGAQLRSCDFCAPRVDVAVEVVTADVVVAEVAVPLVFEEVLAEAVIAEAAALQAPLEEVVAEIVVADLVALPVPVAETRPVAPVSTAKRRPRRVRISQPDAPTTGVRFVVRFQAEAVVTAANIRDALRQAASLGATEVVAITSES
jgi:hypothetical protein